MSREVCGICWCPYDEAGECGCPEFSQPSGAISSTAMLREAAQQALEALEELQYAVVSTAKTDDVSLYYRAIVALRGRLEKGMEQKV